MTITYGPVDATSGSPTYSAKQERQMRAPLLGNPTGRVLGARSGWRVGTLPSVVTVTSTTWTLNPCAAMIEPAAMLYQGAYPWTTDAAVTGAVTAADATNPRVDILYIQINDSSSGDGSGALTAPVNYLAGTAAATPQAPTLPARSFLVATISVPKSGAGAPTVTFNAQYFVAAGGILPVTSQTERDGLTAYAGLTVYRGDLSGNVMETWDGGRWLSTAPVSYTPTLTASTTNPSLGSGTAAGSYSVVGKNLVGQFSIGFGSGSTAGSGSFQIGLPPGFNYTSVSTYVPVGAFAAQGGGAPAAYITGVLRQGGGSQSYLNGYWQSAPTATSVLGSGTYSWASGMNIAGNFTVALA